MNKEEFKSAMSKIKASEKFKEQVEASMKSSNVKTSNFYLKRWASSLAAVIIVAVIGTVALPWLQKVSNKEVAKEDSKITSSTTDNTKNNSNSAEEFKLIGSTVGDASSKAIVFLDGYIYRPSVWLVYSRSIPSTTEYEKIKGDKLGEVTLDLKGKNYIGIPPSFSSTFDVGTEIFTIKNVKKDRAVLIINKGNASIYYCDGKARAFGTNKEVPINLTLSDVINMMTDAPRVTSVELRDENDGSWMRTSEKEQLVSLINTELPKLKLKTVSDFKEHPYKSGYRIPINLVFSDGVALHMQVLPDSKVAAVFDGFVGVSDEFISAIQELQKDGNQYPTIALLMPISENEVSYLYLKNHKNGDEILCKNPRWSRGGLFSILTYYRVEEVPGDSTAGLVMTSKIGTSSKNSVTVDFYETKDKHIIVKLNNHYYKPAKGKITFDELESYLYYNTELGEKRPK